MSAQQVDYYKNIIGDGLSKITVSKDLGEKDFGKGGSVMVSVTLTCDQSEAGINGAIQLADRLATYWTDQHHDGMRKLVQQKGLLK